MQRVTKQSIVSQEQSASLNNINVNASSKQQRAVKAPKSTPQFTFLVMGEK
ncbi:MAG: hypothetical protein IM470_16365 [Microcystis sp. M158S2]|nr:hypothetical protein [Microcystis sp. M158S2]